MVISDAKVIEFNNRILMARLRILLDTPFYGMLLMHMKFIIDNSVKSADTDGKAIYFNGDYLDRLSDGELEFVLRHEILHIALGHPWIKHGMDDYIHHTACDTIVNSNILRDCNNKTECISIGGSPSMHIAPDKSEAYKHSLPEIYDMLQKNPNQNNSMSVYLNSEYSRAIPPSDILSRGKGRFDNHTFWYGLSDDNSGKDIWNKRINDVVNAMDMQIKSGIYCRLPFNMERMIGDLKPSRIDWRKTLAEFLQEVVCDYSFSPPDKRFSESEFMLPDFNDTEVSVRDILFMIDTSGSVNKEMLTELYSEINGAIEQFNGKLKGWLGYFDTKVISPKEFESSENFKSIKPFGGGGTDFKIIFDYVKSHMQGYNISSIIILTDGYAPFPDESDSDGIPVLWCLNNKDVTPPWGRVIRIK